MAGRRATDAEIQHLLREIEIAFRGVKKGVSWSESRIIDSYGTSEERGVARMQDKDKSWEEVSINPNWDPGTGVGGWAFLDPHGFRYYMAAAMTKVLRERSTGNLFTFWLEYSDDRKATYWTEFSKDQLCLVAEFVLVSTRLSVDSLERQKWRKTYEKYWQKLHSQLSQKLKTPERKKGK